MKTWICFILIFLFFQGAGMAQLMDAKSVVGQVTEQKGNTVTIKVNNHELTLGLTGETHIVQGSDAKKASDLHVGDRVTAVYREKGSQRTAVVITITSKK
jgi:uncharacterized OB-fold protein